MNTHLSDSRYEQFPPLVQQMFAVVKCIPPGKVASYGVVGLVVGMHPRQVGFWLHRNPSGESVPCHRVVHSTGELAPGYVFGGQEMQQEKLQKEGVIFRGQGQSAKVDRSAFLSPTELSDRSIAV